MRRIERWLAPLLALVMAVSLTSCGTQQEAEASALEVSCRTFNGIFSPFFAETIADRDAAGLTGLTLLYSDRSGGIVSHGIEGEVIPYNGTDYTYYGPADLNVTENEDGTVFYDVTLREGLVFSDGTPVTIDDVIFSIYVLCDPAYDGFSTLCDQPIEGLAEYRQNNTSLSTLLAGLGEDNADFTHVTREQQSVFWDAVNNGMVEYVRQFIEYYEAELNFYHEDTEELIELTVAEVAEWMGFELKEDVTEKDLALALGNSCGWNFDEIEERVSRYLITPSLPALSTLIPEEVYGYAYINVTFGESAPRISGIQKTGEYSLRVVATRVDVAMIYQLGNVPIAPMHYYGDKALYDYENNSFGFPKGDLSSVRDKIAQPMGAGPYKFIRYEGNVIRYEANEAYYLGAPKTEYVNLRGVPADQCWDEQEGVLNGSVGVTCQYDGTCIIDAVEGAGADQVIIRSVDNVNYECIGLNPYRVCVAGDPGSEASRNLRRAFATLFAVYRDAALEGYDSGLTRVNDYPISGTIWAAHHSGDEGYCAAFSKDVGGSDIYTGEMTVEQRYEAAAAAALEFFEAAGYTVADGVCIAPPEGAALSYEVQVGAFSDDDPCFSLLTKASEALDGMGIELIVTNTYDTEQLEIEFPDVGVCDMWAGGWDYADLSGSRQGREYDQWKDWFSVVDPNVPMYHIYYSGGPIDGDDAGFFYQDVYQIVDPELDQLILAARSTTDQATRKVIYQECLSIITDWACEVPAYQHQDTILFSAGQIKADTIAPDLTASYGWMREIDRIELNQS